MKKFQKFLWILIVFAFAQTANSQSVVFLPSIPEGQAYCQELLNNVQVKATMKEINEYLVLKGQKVPNMQFVMRKMKETGGCNYPDNMQVMKNIANAAGADYFVVTKADAVEERFGKQVLLTLEAYNTASGELITVVEEYSGKYNTDKVPFLARKALEKCYPKLKTEIANGANLEISDNNLNKNIKKTVIESDVDINIPVTNNRKDKTYALIIGNEDYSGNQVGLNSEVNVDFARRDAEIFKQYALKTLGIPEANITLLTDAKALEMDGAIQKINSLAKVMQGDAELVFFYAGHGFPDEQTKEAYLIPVDVNATNLKYAIKLVDVLTKLTEHPTKRVTVFLDACFSGGARNQGLLAARAVKIKPKQALLEGDIIVYTSSSGDQSSLPYKEKGHGLFTYYLLKYFQLNTTQGTYENLSDYLIRQVGAQSILVNGKEQNPQTNVGIDAEEVWKLWKFTDF